MRTASHLQERCRALQPPTPSLAHPLLFLLTSTLPCIPGSLKIIGVFSAVLLRYLSPHQQSGGYSCEAHPTSSLKERRQTGLRGGWLLKIESLHDSIEVSLQQRL